MTANIYKITGQEAYDLIYPEHLAMLSTLNQETMQRTMCNSAEVWVGMDDEQVLAVWGLIPPTLLSDRAYLWLFTTQHLDKHIFMFIRHSQRVVAEMLEQYPVIVGHCVCGADKSIRWLRWLGAIFNEPQGQLIPFEIKAKQWQRVRLAQSE